MISNQRCNLDITQEEFEETLLGMMNDKAGWGEQCYSGFWMP
jgi:hypothetical protein